MAIEDQKIIDWCNQLVRVSSSRMCQAYYGAKTMAAQWIALGSGQNALESLDVQIAKLADYFWASHSDVHKAAIHWLTWSAQAGEAIVPNDAGEQLMDGSPEDGKPGPIYGADIHNWANRCYEFLTWLDTGNFTATAGSGGGGAWLYTILDVSNLGRPKNLGMVGNFMNRCQEIVTDYESGGNAKLNTLIKLSGEPYYSGTGEIIGA